MTADSGGSAGVIPATSAHSYGCEHCTVQVSDELLPLPNDLQARGGEPELLKDELLHIIEQRIAAHPRTLQKALGPSELGTPCPRKLAYKMAGTPEVNPRSAAWKPTVGTAVHTWLEAAMQAWNEGYDFDRFYLEQRVNVGQVGGVDISGNSDCYDRVTATVVDWKIVGLAALKRYKKEGPGEEYRKQAHLYGRGYTRLGLPVDRVAVLFLPQNDELRSAYFWSEPYDEQIALDALNRADGIAALVAGLGAAAPATLPTADAYCTYCPFFMPGATDRAEACNGHTDSGAFLASETAAPAA